MKRGRDPGGFGVCSRALREPASPRFGSRAVSRPLRLAVVPVPLPVLVPASVPLPSAPAAVPAVPGVPGPSDAPSIEVLLTPVVYVATVSGRGRGPVGAREVAKFGAGTSR